MITHAPDAGLAALGRYAYIVIEDETDTNRVSR